VDRTGSSLQDLLKKQQQQHMENMAQMSEIVSAQKSELDQRVQNVEGRVDTLEGRSTLLDTRVDGVDKEINALKQRSEFLEAQLKIANTSGTTREQLNSDQFDRPPCLEIIRINSSRYVTKRSVENTITPWLAETGVTSEQFSLEGSAPNGKNFVVRFKLNTLSAARTVKEVLKTLKDEDGNWRKFNALLVNGQTESLHIGADVGAKARLQRRMGKVLQNAIAELYPNLEEVHYRAHFQSVYAAKVAICHMEPEGPIPGRNHMLWNHPGLAELELDKATLLDRTVQLLERPEDNIQWSL
jgi:sugar-specific transcriptional regulator TrmB